MGAQTRRRRVTGWWCLGVLLCCSACGDTTQQQDGTVDEGAARDSATASDQGVSGDTASADIANDVTESAWGLEERPANPTCLAADRPSTGITVKLTEAFTGSPTFERPVLLVQAPGDDDHFFVVEQTGRIRRFHRSTPQTVELVLDHTTVVEYGGEKGLLGLAFHPQFASNAYIFLSYTFNRGSELWSRISRWTLAAAGEGLKATDELPLLEVRQPYSNHNGGHIAFGPPEGPASRRLLYIALGDGGSGGDPRNNGQNTSTLLGALLRIDVDTTGPAGQPPYGIPTDNPFADGVEGLPEIYAWGLRNPWRFSFDRATGQLWAGDVGQSAFEEIDRISLGGNYGWRIKEGFGCYKADTCEQAGLTDPVVDYDRSEGRSVTGGYVYRGTTMPKLVGSYVYGDYVTGRIWGLFLNESSGDLEPRLLVEGARNISSFAEDNEGELYVLDLIGGHIKRMELAAEPPSDSFPQLLSKTGCFDPEDPTLPAAGLIPYDVKSELWADGLLKRRWLAIPDESEITVAVDGDMELPVGSVVVKMLTDGGQRIETRLLMHHEDGWAGYAYQWNAEQTEAALLPAGKRVKLAGGGTWQIPSRAECLSCHTEAAGRTLGLELAQLNGMLTYDTGLRANQLATLEHIGVLDSSVAPSDLPVLAGLSDSAPVQQRARSYLHTNCSFCHRDSGPGRGELDLRRDRTLSQTGLCDVPPLLGDLGLADARLLAPGSAARSVLSARLKSLDVNRMPPLATQVMHTQATDVIDAWIAATTACP